MKIQNLGTLSCASVRRDEEAVSAAIGTVLLFAGVLSIVGVMLATMVPVIDELQGAVERSDMSSQMYDLSTEIDQLSSNGMPGDLSDGTLKGIEGKFSWQNLQGGMWISAAWNDGSSLRLNDALDLDRRIDLRHPGEEIAAVCFEDMRLGAEIFTHYRIPAIEGTLVVSPDAGLAQSQGPMELRFVEDGNTISESISDDQIWSMETSGTESWLSLDSPAQVILIKGDGGSAILPAQSQNPATGEGRSWRIPLIAGFNEVTLVSSHSMDVDWRMADQEGSDMVIKADSFHQVGTTWSQQWNVEENSILTIQSSSDARLLLRHDSQQNDGISSGSTFWPGTTGSMLATTFQPPGLEGSIIFHNPGKETSTIRWGTGATSVGPESTTRVSWPPQSGSSLQVTAGDPINLIWTSDSQSVEANRSGLDIIPANDTGMASGHSHFMIRPANTTIIHAQVAGFSSTWTDISENITRTSSHDSAISPLFNIATQVKTNANESNDGLRIIAEMGEHGMISLLHDGDQRCRSIGIRASGWISTQLPWEELSADSNTEVQNAWLAGNHPASIKITILGDDGEHELSTLSTAWAMHSPRLVYTFSSSIKGLEVAMRSGAVVTNHPEVEPAVIKKPVDRAGPGPRFAITVPLLTPSSGSSTGSGEFEVELELMQRISLTSSSAGEVRRGWDGPYGTAIAASASKDLRASEDWTAAPMRLDMLNDYKGWVPHPSMDSSETIYHAQGESIQFSLQVSLVSCTMNGV